MQRIPRLPIFLLIAGAAVLTADAQQTAQASLEFPTESLAFLLPFLPSIPRAPVSATFVIQVAQPLPNGGTETWRSMTLLARDSSGRTRYELHKLIPSSPGEPPLLYVVLLDPLSHERQTLDPVRRIDFKQRLPILTPFRNQSAIDEMDGEDLGSKTIDGLDANGLRRNWMIPYEHTSGGAGQAVEETWYSKELEMLVSGQRTDSSGQVITITMTHLDRSEPPASLFKPPRGYSQRPHPPGQGIWSIMPPDFDGNDQFGTTPWCCFIAPITGR